jgi:hypothetical protein
MKSPRAGAAGGAEGEGVDAADTDIEVASPEDMELRGIALSRSRRRLK